MSEALVNLISEGRRLKTSFVPRLSDEGQYSRNECDSSSNLVILMLYNSTTDVASVWALVSEFIEKQMLQRKVHCQLCL